MPEALWSASWTIRRTATVGAARADRPSASSSISTPWTRASISTSLRSAPLQAVALELGRSQPEDQRAELVQRLARDELDPLELGPRAVGIRVELRRGGLGAEHQAEQLLADDVVELEREPVALGDDRQLAAALVQPRVRDRDRGVRGEQLDQLLVARRRTR